jgi:hypothetical protein
VFEAGVVVLASDEVVAGSDKAHGLLDDRYVIEPEHHVRTKE